MQRCSFTINKFLLMALCMLVIALTASCSKQPLYPAPPLNGTNVSIEIASLPMEVPQFYTFRSGDKNVNFFVLRMKDKVLSFFDACITCYPSKRGYRYEDGYVICGACNTTYSIYKLEKGIGGCYPIRLEGKTETGRYLIPVSALERMASKF